MSGQTDKPSDSPQVKETQPKKTILPSLVAFFSDEAIPVSGFIKVLGTEKIKAFSNEDEEHAWGLLEKNDADGKRLWQLVSCASLPDPLFRWVWRIVPERLRVTYGNEVSFSHSDPVKILKELRDVLVPKLKSDIKSEKAAAENWLRISICWLVEMRSLDLWALSTVMEPALFTNRKQSLKEIKRGLQRGNIKDFKLALAASALAEETVAEAYKERDAEKRLSTSLKSQLEAANARIEKLVADVKELETALVQKTTELATCLSTANAERQHSGHDLSSIKATHKILLVDRILPLVSDAADALDIEPPANQIASSRLKDVLAIIEEARK